MIWRFYHKAVTASTNFDARSGSHGDVFTAACQTNGRGRLDHQWISAPDKNLTFSAVLSVTGIAAQEIPTLALVAGLAVAKTIQSLLPARSIQLKWPNDVLVGGRKICGILCERSGDNIIVGIGINVMEREFPLSISTTATSLALEASSESFKTEVVLALVLKNLANYYERWIASGFSAIHPEIKEFDLLKNRLVAVSQTDSDSAPVKGMCAGIQPDGTLLVGATPVFAGEAHIDEY